MFLPRISPVYPDASDVALVSYTIAGKNGVKRIELTHAQLLAHVLTCEIHNPVPWHESSLSFVPWSEPSAMTHELLAFMRKGAKVYACEGKNRMRYNSQELGPTVIHSRADAFKIFQQSFERDVVYEKLFEWVLDAAMTSVFKVRSLPTGSSLSFVDRCKAFVGRRCMERARPMMGGKRLQKVVCHGSPFPPAAQRLFTVMGIQMEVIRGSLPLPLPFSLQRSAHEFKFSKTRRLMALARGEQLLPKPFRKMPAAPLRALAGYKVEAASPEAGSELVLSAHGVLLGESVASGRVQVASGSRGAVTDGSVSITGTVDELEVLVDGQLLPSRIEEFVLAHAALIIQACAIATPSGDIVVVAVPDYEALFKLHESRTDAEFKVAPAHLLADYTLRALCEKQMDHVLALLRSDPTLVTPSALPTKYILVSQNFTVADGTLSPMSLLEPRRDVVARLHVE